MGAALIRWTLKTWLLGALALLLVGVQTAGAMHAAEFGEGPHSHAAEHHHHGHGPHDAHHEHGDQRVHAGPDEPAHGGAPGSEAELCPLAAHASAAKNVLTSLPPALAAPADKGHGCALLSHNPTPTQWLSSAQRARAPPV